MQKIQVFLREDQKTALKSLSARTGMRQSDLVRQGVDLLLEGASRRTTDWREATRAVAGLWQDHEDLKTINEELRASFRRRFPAVYRRQ
jgi:Ribbon-helix-helix domain